MGRSEHTADVGTTLRDMWETRPARPRRDRKVAGVAAAIARRYDIDPVLVRVGFAVAAVYGVGIALYVAGWLLLPAADQDDPLDGAGPRPATGGVHPAAWIGLGVLVLATGGVFWGDNGGFVLPVLAVLVLLFLLHRSRGGSRALADDGAASGPGAVADGPVGNAGSRTDGVDTPAAGGTTEDRPASGAGHPDAPTTPLSTSAAATGEPAVHADPLDRGTPPEWDPLGAAPFAWDLPEPARPEPEPAPRARRTRITLITLACALVGGGIAGAVVLMTAGIAGLPIVFATPLAVVGVGLVIGAFARSGRGLIPFALILGLLTWGSVAVRDPLQNIGQGGVGDISVAPTSAAALAPTYERGAGTIALDLSRLDTSVPPGTDATPIRTAATVGLGTVEVTVPADADVTVRAHAELGDVLFGTTDQGGTDARLTVVDDLGADGVRSGRPIELDLQAGLGSVEVRRG
ncbi:PspC domain-containing protein [Pseudonocardia xishanensis]|uniref:PspC domain-containing protein n=1 Tax=Pseudonocardia xishanensis TaxID=630995 RepID=A0ABP8RT72_9PSEU